MISISNKRNCSSCGSCKKEVAEGVLNPEFCPILNHSNENDKQLLAYACRSKRDDILLSSTSGGMFSEIAIEVIRRGGVVFGAEYDDDYNVRHSFIEDVGSLINLRRSKYIQSNLNSTLCRAKSFLEEKRYVLLAGTPCQINGLINFLGKDYLTLICIDVVCRGVNSPAVWYKYLRWQEAQQQSKIINVAFREKSEGFHSSMFTIEFENGHIFRKPPDVDWFSRFYTSALCLRPSCYQCHFKSEYRISDFTLFDCWSFEKLVTNVEDDDKGYTTVLIQSEKGRIFFDSIKPSIVYYEVLPSIAINLDGVMVNKSVVRPNNRDLFFNDFKSYVIEELGKTYTDISIKIRIRESIKWLLRKTNLLMMIKKIRRIYKFR